MIRLDNLQVVTSRIQEEKKNYERDKNWQTEHTTMNYSVSLHGFYYYRRTEDKLKGK